MRVLITGVAGFIGSHLADFLLAKKAEVYGVDNFATGTRENIDRAGTEISISPSLILRRLIWPVPRGLM